VGEFRLSRLAEADLLSIGVYTLRTWGEAQTIRYIDELEDVCRQLANSPASGRSCDHIRPGLYRREAGKHVIFFRREPTGILVSRILHERMVPERRSFEDED
jgi:toxin ParE1/3/4